MPPMNASMRHTSFIAAFQAVNVKLDERAVTDLGDLAASAVMARGRAFLQVAETVKASLGDKNLASVKDLREGMSTCLGANIIHLTVPTNASKNLKVNLFESVGGNAKAKLALEDALALDATMKRKLALFQLSPPTGVLLYGPPGCGKTLLARAVADTMRRKVGSTSGEAFLSLRASEVVQSTVGSSEKAIARAFETARANAPAVVFIDEFEALFTERGRNSAGGLASVLSQCMDDISQWRESDEVASSSKSMQQGSNETNSGRIIVLGATNMPWMIDKAFMRPGRFDRIVHVGLPSEEERTSILKVHLCRMRLDLDGKTLDDLCATVSSRCEGFSGADLQGLCRAAAIRCINEEKGRTEVSMNDFLQARELDMVPSCDEALVRRLMAWQP
jgi:SpoVK/Ycf46/Vps4 family AAA+-type ATPase